MLCGPAQLWPRPTGPLVLGSKFVRFRLAQLRLETDAREPALSSLRAAYRLFLDHLPTKTDSNISDVSEVLLRISVSDSLTTRLRLDTSEAYNFTVRFTDETDQLRVDINARNFFGARHGLETFAQLVWSESDGLAVLRSVRLEDAPKFAYRGLLLDTARNFVPLDGLKRVLVGMGANKLNTLHWHVSDSQSFPLEVKAVPELARFGAYSAGMTYREEDVEEVVEFARLRGVRVVMEVDAPAHAGNGWTWGPQKGLGAYQTCETLKNYFLES